MRYDAFMFDLVEYVAKYDTSEDYLQDEMFTRIGPKARDRGYLTPKDLVEIGRWKFRGLYSKKHELELRSNPEKAVRTITRFAFMLGASEAVELLSALKGVSVPMASAMLAIVFPDQFAVIDVRAWATLLKFNLVPERKSFTPEDYGLYMGVVRDLAKRHGITPRQVDMALFAYDGDHREGQLYK